MLLRPLKGKPAQIWRIRAGRGAHPSLMTGGELPGRHAGAGPGGHGEVLRGNRGDAAGAELGSSSAERIAVNAGTVSVLPVLVALPAPGSGWVRRRPIGPGRGGAAVVLRAGESPAHGEGRQRLREGKEAAMPQDAPLNGSAPDPASGPWSRVAGMQAKLHRWAAADPGRRFEDLFSFVHDPATLYVALLPGRGQPGREHARRGRDDRRAGRGAHRCPGVPG